jgi:hypothetical protein
MFQDRLVSFVVMCGDECTLGYIGLLYRSTSLYIVSPGTIMYGETDVIHVLRI